MTKQNQTRKKILQNRILRLAKIFLTTDKKEFERRYKCTQLQCACILEKKSIK